MNSTDEKHKAAIDVAIRAAGLDPRNIFARETVEKTIAAYIDAASPAPVAAGDWVMVPREIAETINGAFLPSNPRKLRSASPETIMAAEYFKAVLAALTPPAPAQPGAEPVSVNAMEEARKLWRLTAPVIWSDPAFEAGWQAAHVAADAQGEAMRLAEALADQVDHCLLGYAISRQNGVSIEDAMLSLRIACDEFRSALASETEGGR